MDGGLLTSGRATARDKGVYRREGGGESSRFGHAPTQDVGSRLPSRIAKKCRDKRVQLSMVDFFILHYVQYLKIEYVLFFYNIVEEQKSRRVFRKSSEMVIAAHRHFQPERCYQLLFAGLFVRIGYLMLGEMIEKHRGNGREVGH
ncbi:hypothetical protein EVAR_92558_1 [Eumeta japonica]|uniref:Uncharacterized protein n=1 Tax=Eumeta variegata TaxID=151549 RepID=A0A4C1SWK5_EUMVA|nr:hypothetical protein EVAR_92558_1 [Eumeta japonica]